MALLFLGNQWKLVKADPFYSSSRATSTPNRDIKGIPIPLIKKRTLVSSANTSLSRICSAHDYWVNLRWRWHAYSLNQSNLLLMNPLGTCWRNCKSIIWMLSKFDFIHSPFCRVSQQMKKSLRWWNCFFIHFYRFHSKGVREDGNLGLLRRAPTSRDVRMRILCKWGDITRHWPWGVPEYGLVFSHVLTLANDVVAAVPPSRVTCFRVLYLPLTELYFTSPIDSGTLLVAVLLHSRRGVLLLWLTLAASHSFLVLHVLEIFSEISYLSEWQWHQSLDMWTNLEPFYAKSIGWRKFHLVPEQVGHDDV